MSVGSVALLNPVYWPEVRRGSERFAHDLGRALVADGLRTTLITSHKGPWTRREEDGFEVLRVPRPPLGAVLGRLRYQEHLAHLPLAYLALRRTSPDVAHALHPSDALAALRWQERTGRPAIVSFMGMGERARIVALRRRAEIIRTVARGCRAAVALSHAAAGAFQRELGIEMRVIHPGVDVERFTPEPEARAPVPTIFCAAAVSDPRKRVGLLVEAFALLRRELPEARLVLSKPRGADEARPFEALPGVELRDVDAAEALVAAYREAWTTALVSTGEAFGLVLVEALACGTPVVGADSGAIPEVLDRPEVGGLLTGDDPAELARVLRDTLALAQAPGTAAACRSRAQEFSFARTALAYRALYDELAAA